MRSAMVSLPLAIALLAGASAGAAPRDRDGGVSRQPIPSSTPITISVQVAPNIRSNTVEGMLAEADAIWRSSGVTFVWRRAADCLEPYAESSEAGRDLPSMLRVTVDDQVGDWTDGVVPLGWIRFDRMGEPGREIHISYRNAQALLAASAVVVGDQTMMPALQRETYLARAMGRALAHELGHYLMASTAHTEHGLMQKRLSARSLFSGRVRFEIDATQRQFVASRLARTMRLAQRSTQENPLSR
jgi:hypothetical protein